MASWMLVLPPAVDRAEISPPWPEHAAPLCKHACQARDCGPCSRAPNGLRACQGLRARPPHATMHAVARMHAHPQWNWHGCVQYTPLAKAALIASLTAPFNWPPAVSTGSSCMVNVLSTCGTGAVRSDTPQREVQVGDLIRLREPSRHTEPPGRLRRRQAAAHTTKKRLCSPLSLAWGFGRGCLPLNPGPPWRSRPPSCPLPTARWRSRCCRSVGWPRCTGSRSRTCLSL